MPMTTEPRENGRVIYIIATDPVTLEDFEKSFVIQNELLDRGTAKVHQFVNVTQMRQVPRNAIKLRENSPILHHPNAGILVFVGANAFVRIISETITRLTH